MSDHPTALPRGDQGSRAARRLSVGDSGLGAGGVVGRRRLQALGLIIALVLGPGGNAAGGPWSLVPDVPPADRAPLRIRENVRISIPPLVRQVVFPEHPTEFAMFVDYGGKAVVYSLAAEQEVATLQEKFEIGYPSLFTLSGDGTRVLGADSRDSRSAAFNVWNVVTGEREGTLSLKKGSGTLQVLKFVTPEIAVTSPGSTGKTAMVLWDLTTMKELRQFSLADDIEKDGVAVSPTGKYLAVTHRSKNIISLFETETGRLLESLTWNRGDSSWTFMNGVAFSPDGRQLAALGVDGSPRLLVWDLGTGELLSDQRIAARPYGALEGRPAYPGAALRWYPDGSGWLCFGFDGFRRGAKEPSFTLVPPAVDNGNVGEYVFVAPHLLCFPTKNRDQLCTLQIPTSEGPPQRTDQSPQPLLTTGDAVKVDVQVSETRFVTADEVRNKLRLALDRQLRHLGLRIAPNDEQPAITLRVTYAETKGPEVKRPDAAVAEPDFRRRRPGEGPLLLPPPLIFGPRFAPPPQESQRPGQGTGFVVSSTGHVVTCAHVVKTAQEMSLKLGDRKLRARVIAKDDKLDLALLKYDGKDEAFLRLRDSDAFELGEDVRAVGFPLSDVLGDAIKVTRGTLSGSSKFENRNVFLVDAALNPGNSGGPLIDKHGRVLGVNFLKLLGREIDRVGMAVPVNELKSLFEAASFKPSDQTEPPLEGMKLNERLQSAVLIVAPVGTYDVLTGTDIEATIGWWKTGASEPLWSKTIRLSTGTNPGMAAALRDANDAALRESVATQAQQRLLSARIPSAIDHTGKQFWPRQIPLEVTGEPADLPVPSLFSLP